MAQNEEIALSLEAQPVPPDLECLGNINMTQLLARLVQLLVIEGSGGTQPGQVFPSAVVIATQAKEEAQAAQESVDALALRVPQVRNSDGLIGLATGDSTLSISWSPDMPSANYSVALTFFRPGGHPSAYYGFTVIVGSRTIAGCQINLDNIPANTQASWTVTELLVSST